MPTLVDFVNDPEFNIRKCLWSETKDGIETRCTKNAGHAGKHSFEEKEN